MISFQLEDESVVFISPCAIIAIEPLSDSTGSRIIVNGNLTYRSNQSPEYIAEIIINAKKACH